MLRPCGSDDVAAIHAIINEAAQACRGVIPADRWKEPYLSHAELRAEMDADVAFRGWELDGALVAVTDVQPPAHWPPEATD